MRIRLAVVLMMVGAVVLTGCGGKKEEAKSAPEDVDVAPAQQAEDETAAAIVSKAMSMASGEDVKVKVDGDKVTFTAEQGDVTIQGGEGTELPKDFPEDMPVYKNAVILHTATSGKDMFTVSLQSKDPVKTVSDFYKSTMESKGWESQTTMDMPNRSILAYKKGNRVASLMIAADNDGGTVISLNSGVDK